VTILKGLRVFILNFFLLTIPMSTVWAGAVKKAEKLERQVDLANLSGISYFFAKWYNENLWVYALIATVLMGLVGLAIAFCTDIILKMIGMDVSKIEHHE
jgi:ABC-type phosphate/phosphonate transport system permease subunit